MFILVTCIRLFFFFNTPATTEIYTLSLHDALPIWVRTLREKLAWLRGTIPDLAIRTTCLVGFPGEAEDDFRALLAEVRSEEHTSELQSHSDLVCRLLLEKKKKKT